MTRPSTPSTRPPVSRRRRGALVLLGVLGLLLGALTPVLAPLAVPDLAPRAAAAVAVPDAACRRLDPNLVRGVCLRYELGGRTAHTWLGTYRTPDGSIFFCIDWLYDSRLPSRARLVSTEDLRNQLGQRIGDAEVAALNQLVSRWAPRGSTGSDVRDAAIALIVREVMSDGVRRGGVVYPRGLEVGEPVQPPVGGLPGPVVPTAEAMWRQASRWRGPYRVRLTTRAEGPVRLGRVRAYRVVVRAATGAVVPGLRVRLACSGPVRCPAAVRSRLRPVRVLLRPTGLGRLRLRAEVEGPASDGRLHVVPGWRAHGGPRARDAGVQRGWIAGRSTARAAVTVRAEVRRARPRVVTETSAAEVRPGEPVHDVVRVSGAPSGYRATATATFYGPYPSQPGRADCGAGEVAGQVRFTVRGNATYRTPPVTVSEPGYYTWVQELPGGRRALPVRTPCGLVPETTLVRRAVPVVTTEVSRQRATVGARLRDTVTVSGLGAALPVRVTWTLHGPLPARSHGCAGLAWGTAPVAARGVVAVPGDGTYRTAPTRVRAAGCYTYSATVAATARSEAATHPPGLAVQTALVEPRTPRVRTRASAQRALVGDVVHDRIWVTGLPAWGAVTAHWTLHGPIAPRPDGTCDRLDWAGAPVADRGVVVVRRNGEHAGGRTRITAPGCHTYSVRLPATGATAEVLSPAGHPLETLLARRPSIPFVPEVPTGPAVASREGARPAVRTPGLVLRGSAAGPWASAPTARAVPQHRWNDYRATTGTVARSTGMRLQVPAVGVDAPVHRVGLDGGAMAVPHDVRRVGWLGSSAAPGDAMGSAVFSGHVTSRTGRPGAFSRLRLVQRGQRVRWVADGRAHTYVVTGVRRYSRAAGVPGSVFRTDGPAVLHLVTCAGRVATDTGFHYTQNLVVTARRVSAGRG